MRADDSEGQNTQHFIQRDRTGTFGLVYSSLFSSVFSHRKGLVPDITEVSIRCGV